MSGFDRVWPGPRRRRSAAPGLFTSATRAVAVGLAAVSLLLAAACDIRVRVGKRPDPSLLETSLKIGQSNQSDVQAALGKPQGRGRSLLPIAEKPRTMWSYHFEEGDLNDTRRIFLFVYFDEDERYDGYMWFSSFPK